MNKKIQKLQQEIEKIKKTLKFMTRYSKDDIEFCRAYNKKMFRYTYAARFIKDEELCMVCLPIILELPCKFIVLENDEKTATLLCKQGLYEIETYIILDKINEKAVEYKNLMQNKKQEE